MATALKIVRWRRENPDKLRKIQNRYRLSIRGTACFLCKGARSRALAKGLNFDLTNAWVAEKLLSGKCEATGISFVHRVGKGKSHPFAPTLDRIKPRLGYVKGNVRVVIFALNVARGHWGDRVLERVCRAYLNRITG